MLRRSISRFRRGADGLRPVLQFQDGGGELFPHSPQRLDLILDVFQLLFGQADNGAQFVRSAVNVSGRQTRDGHVELEKLSNFLQRESQLLRPFDELQSIEI